jgi:hypothetical protein
VTLLHEFAARGVRTMAASDNCRDPFFAYGDHDALEVFDPVLTRAAIAVERAERAL